MTPRDHANCAPGCHLHPELHHAGWIQSGSERWHYFMPGMNISECGLIFAMNSVVRHQKIDYSPVCVNCVRSVESYAIKLRKELGDDDDDR